MLRLWDWLLALAVLGFSLRPNGPLSVLIIAFSLLYCSQGRPRIHVYPLIWTALLFGVAGAWLRGLESASFLWISFISAKSAVLGAALLSLALALFLDHIIFEARLPEPTGPYAVVQCSVHLRSSNRGTETMVRVYYPVKPLDAEEHGLPRAPYVLNGTDTTDGFAKLMGMPGFMFSWVRYAESLCYSGDFSPVLPRPVAQLSPQATFGKQQQQTKPAGKLPVVIFSHGLGGVPEIYSSIICDLVSHGFVVLAPEHADSSAAYAALPFGSETSGRMSTNHDPEGALSAQGALSSMSSGRIKRYVRLSKEQIDDLPLAHKIRHAQLQQRTREAQAAIDLADWLSGKKPRDAAGEEDDEAEDSSDSSVGLDLNGSVMALREVLGGRVETRASSSKGKGGKSGDATRGGGGVAVCGHSFGAATSISCADKDPRVRAVVALDPWMFPLSSSTLQRGLKHAPSFAVCGDYFTSWAANSNALKLLFSSGHRSMHLAADEADLLRAMEAWEKSTSSSLFGQPRNRQQGSASAGSTAGSKASKGKGYGNSMTKGTFVPKPLPLPPSRRASNNPSPTATATTTGATTTAASTTPHSEASTASHSSPKEEANTTLHYDEDEDDKPSISIHHCNAVDPRDGSIHPVFKAAPNSHPHEGNLLLTLKQTEHQNFNDFSILGGKPVKWLDSVGNMDVPRSVEAIRLLTRGFIVANLVLEGSVASDATAASSIDSKPSKSEEKAELLRSISLEPGAPNALAIKLLIEGGHKWVVEHLCPAAWTAAAPTDEDEEEHDAPASPPSAAAVVPSSSDGSSALTRASSFHSQRSTGSLSREPKRESDARAAAADRDVSREKRQAEIAADNADR